ncbi:helix-turn-helix domain-containing protein, partial [Bacillus cereus]|nr:helix-turn-helix domain-containing protein [Bacillus cereus]
VLTPAMRAQCLKEWEALRTRLVQEAAPDSAIASGLLERLEAEDPLRQLADRDGLTWEEWERHWLEALQRLSDALSARQGREQHIIFDIARYVEQHYNEDLSLQDMAERFYVSREYISRKFKQQFGINLSDYWTGIRIEKAKRLLLNPHLRIAQVGEMVGYQDEKYFSKVFKKVEGVSPNLYRKQHGGA